MWAHPPTRNLIDMQRRQVLVTAGLEAQRLLREGYAVEADRVLDAAIERARSW